MAFAFCLNGAVFISSEAVGLHTLMATNLSESAAGRKALRTFGRDEGVLVGIDWFEDNASRLDLEDWREMRWRLTSYLYTLVRALEKTRLPWRGVERRGPLLQAAVWTYLRFAANVAHNMGLTRFRQRLPEAKQDLQEAQRALEEFRGWLAYAREVVGGDARTWLRRAEGAHRTYENLLPRIAALDGQFAGPQTPVGESMKSVGAASFGGFREWLRMQESSPLTRSRDAAALGLGPPIADFMSRSTPTPWALKNAKAAFAATHKKKKKRKKHKGFHHKPTGLISVGPEGKPNK
jgi:hypothetical protein